MGGRYYYCIYAVVPRYSPLATFGQATLNLQPLPPSGEPLNLQTPSPPRCVGGERVETYRRLVFFSTRRRVIRRGVGLSRLHPDEPLALRGAPTGPYECPPRFG